MNRSKARDFFSDYYEDSLSPGIRQTMDNAFGSDPELRRDYEAFVALVGGLDSLRNEEIEPVGFLSERIEARLNQIDQERRSVQRPFLVRFWMPVTAGAMMGAALLGFLLALQPQASGNAETASIVSGASASGTPKISIGEDGQTYFSYSAAGKVNVTVRLASGEIINSIDLKDEVLRSPLRNEGPQPQLLEVSLSNSGTKIWIALPGRQHLPAASGRGTVRDFAKALAGTYRVPVEVATKSHNATVSWNLNGADPIDEVTQSMKDLGITIDVRESNVLLIAD